MKSRATVVAVCSGIVGVLAGGYLTAWFISRFLNSAATTYAVATIVTDGAALQKLHSGDTDAATQQLQIRLDGELITIGAEVKAGSKLTPQAQNAIAQLKRLRESTGYEPTDPNVRGLVREALELGATND